MILNKEKTINASADKVWKIFAHDFDDAHVWMASIPNSFGKQLGKKFEDAHTAGRVCELDTNPKGLKALETIEAYNEEKRALTVKVKFRNAPPVFPFKLNVANFKVKSLEKGRCRVFFKANIKLSFMGYLMYPLVRFGFPMVLGQILDELKYFAENDMPHPRKVKALSKLKRAEVTA
jgi:hypothetical protein